MKVKLVGFNQYTITKDKNTGEVAEVLQLHFVRKPNLREAGAQGLVTVACTLYDEQIKKLAETVQLKVEADYECDINQFKGKNYLNSMTAI